MKRLFYGLIALAACWAVTAAPAFAQTSKIPAETSPEAGPNCDITGYKSFEITGQFQIPDGDPTGVTIGPILTPADGDIINDVIIDLRAQHTWIGDLIAVVTYDPDCDGPLAAVSTRILCRQRGTSAAAPGPCGTGTGFGCSGDLTCGGQLLFSDEATAEVAVGTCPTAIPPGCYKPTGGSLSIFRGLLKGGCWYLTVSDNASDDVGQVCQFSVHLRNQRPTPANSATWGNVKNIYR